MKLIMVFPLSISQDEITDKLEQIRNTLSHLRERGWVGLIMATDNLITIECASTISSIRLQSVLNIPFNLEMLEDVNVIVRDQVKNKLAMGVMSPSDSDLISGIERFCADHGLGITLGYSLQAYANGDIEQQICALDNSLKGVLGYVEARPSKLRNDLILFGPSTKKLNVVELAAVKHSVNSIPGLFFGAVPAVCVEMS